MNERIFFCFFLSIKTSLTEFPTNPCYVDNEACDTNEDNLITSITGVTSLEDCRAHCYGESLCKFFTYYGPDSFPLSNICMILSSCEDTFQCDDCHSEDSFCFRYFQLNSTFILIFVNRIYCQELWRPC